MSVNPPAEKVSMGMLHLQELQRDLHLNNSCLAMDDALAMLTPTAL